MNKDNEQKQMKDLPQWLQTLWEISPMLARTAENDYINLKEQLRIGSVSQQRELLKAFADWCDKQGLESIEWSGIKGLLKEYESL